MTVTTDSLTQLADAVLLPCFDGTAAPDWIRRRVAESLGGVCLFARNIGDREVVQSLSQSLVAERGDVVIAIDEEAGDVTRLDAATGSRFPGAAALGTVDDVGLTATIAGEVGTLLAAVGVSLNFAPCADVVVDPANPVIGSRSFGADVTLVARHTAAWVTGQQQAGVAACAKHFPGHGDTDVDTHRGVAVLAGDLDALLSAALPPFRAAIEAGVAAVMAGHLLAPAVDDLPATLSRRWLTDILRGELGFRGTIVTDALEMAAISATYGMAAGAVRALAAGADLLCLGGESMEPAAVDAVRDAIVAAVRSGQIGQDRLAEAAQHAAALGVSAVRSSLPSGASGVPGASDMPAARAFEQWDPAASTDVSSNAVSVVGVLPALRAPVLLLRCEAAANIAVGAIPWSPARFLPSPVNEIVLRKGDVPPVGPLAAAGSVLLVTRDRHRHPWMRQLVERVRRDRPDSVLLEMGISGVDAADAPAVATYGATAANGRAVAAVLSE